MEKRECVLARFFVKRLTKHLLKQCEVGWVNVKQYKKARQMSNKRSVGRACLS